MKHVFFTGGAGFLGRAYLKWASTFEPEARFTVYSTDEEKQAKVRRQFPQHTYILGDVRDYDRLKLAMAGHDVVIHAAAMKYVPEGERNVEEAVSVNVDGSRNVVKAAIHNGVEKVVGISTDKACEPISVYGVTKLLMERLFAEYNRLSPTRFHIVRYGNVVASSGSAIPLFRQQAREKREVTLTNPEMTRFWLSADEAIRLINVAVASERGGTVLIPRLPSCALLDTARAAVRLELPFDWATVKFTTIGQRFGEKVHESLLGDVEKVYAVPGPTLLLYPVVEGIREGHVAAPYTSEKADHRLSIDEMVELIKGASE